jgi:transmembrane sensor
MIAATVAVLLFILAAIVTAQTFNGVDRYETRVGEIRTVALADGSRLHLNSDSAAEVRFTKNGRRVRLLKGEAGFEVTHDPQRAFEVEARSALVRTVGTAFNLRLRPALIELTVLQPRSLVLTHLDPKVIHQRTAWRRKLVQLEGETVEQAADEFNRYRTAPILIGDTRVSSLRIGGQFHIVDSAKFLSALQSRLPVRVVDGEDGSVMLLYRDLPSGAASGN